MGTLNSMELNPLTNCMTCSMVISLFCKIASRFESLRVYANRGEVIEEFSGYLYSAIPPIVHEIAQAEPLIELIVKILLLRGFHYPEKFPMNIPPYSSWTINFGLQWGVVSGEFGKNALNLFWGLLMSAGIITPNPSVISNDPVSWIK